MDEKETTIIKYQSLVKDRIAAIDLKDFSKWLSQPENKIHDVPKNVGVKKDRARDLRAKLDALATELKAGHGIRIKEAALEKLFEKAEKFLSASSAYIDTKKSSDTGEPEPRHTWFLYFLHTTGRSDNRPKIARIVLKIFKDMTVKIVNLKEAKSEDYTEGQCRQIKNSSVWYFTLKNKPEPENTRELHFKVHYPNGKYEILTGAYTTYDQKDITSGSILLEKVTKSVCDRIGGDKNVKPLTICYTDPDPQFDQVPVEIQEFLALKRKNFYKVPDPFWNLEELGQYLKKDLLSKSRESRFFDPQKPNMFIATPQTSILGLTPHELENHNSYLTGLMDDLKLVLTNIHIDYFSQSEISKTDEDPFKSLKTLQRTRYFVLILGDINKATFSMVQLGWALSYSKHIIVFHKKDNISNRVKALVELNVKFIEYENFSKDINGLIKEEIIQHVNKTLT